MTRSIFLLITLLSGTVALYGQGGTQSPPAALATQLPLTGRAGQTGSVTSSQNATPGTTSSVNTLNSTVNIQGPYSGSVTGKLPFAGKLSLKEAIQRGLEYNLGAVGLTQATRQSSGQARVARSSLLPNLNSSLKESIQQTNIAALGIRSPNIPTIVGPYNFFDLRATLTQTIADMTALHNYRSAQQTVIANQQWMRDARDLIVLAVGGSYLQVLSAKARVESAKAQLETVRASYDQSLQQRQAGLLAQTDVNRNLVAQQTQQQRLTTLENDFSKQKINLARLTGLPPNDHYDVTDDVAYLPAPPVTIEEAMKQAFETRADLKAAHAQVTAAERTRAAARSERLPSLAVAADYGVIGTNPAQSHGTFSVTGVLRVPIWQGGRVEGDVEQADAALQQRRAEEEDLRGRIESDLRGAFLDLQAASSQVEVAKSNQAVARETLKLTRERLDAGVTDNLEVIQARESVASADLDYITSLFAHNLAKLTVARSLGNAEDKLTAYLGVR
jgi:outer membrane protein TolC